MTAYWDDLAREIRDLYAADEQRLSDEGFLAAVLDIETRVIHTVSLVTGDREFPDDLRNRIQGVIATRAIEHPRHGPQNLREHAWLLTMRSSSLITTLHSVFHAVAIRKPPNRYDTYFTDDPTSFLRARDVALKESP